MTETNTGVSDTTAAQTPINSVDEVLNDDHNQKQVSYDSHRRLLSEKKKLQQAQADTLAKLAEYEAEKESEHAAKLAEQGRFKELLDTEKEKFKSVETELNGYKQKVQNSMKFNALKSTLGADIPHKYASVIDFNSIDLDESGRPEEMSVTKAAEMIRKEFPEIIISTATTGTTPAAAPTGTTPKTIGDMTQAEKLAKLNELSPL